MVLQQLLPVLVGFLLTTVLGGLLGVVLQKRAWNHQHRVQAAERERDRAVAVFEEVSRLLDRRLYRARLLRSSLGPHRDDDERAGAMVGYREVLLEWNDGINRNLALLQRYFGERARAEFDEDLGARLVEVGRALEAQWASRHDPGGDTEHDRVEEALNDLAERVYRFNLTLIDAIRARGAGEAVR